MRHFEKIKEKIETSGQGKIDVFVKDGVTVYVVTSPFVNQKFVYVKFPPPERDSTDPVVQGNPFLMLGSGPIYYKSEELANIKIFERMEILKKEKWVARGEGAVNFLLAICPGVNILVGAYEAYEGKDVFGKELSDLERGLSGAGAALPFVGKLVGETAKVLRARKELGLANELEKSYEAVNTALKAGTKGAELARIVSKFEEAAAKVMYSMCKDACFVAGTPLLTPGGVKAIEQFKPGDLVLSRDESDPNGFVEPKVVERVFVRAGRVLWLTVSGRRIGTTAEHPFYVVGTGWRPAGELEYGDVLSSHNGTVGVVESVVQEEETITVYNMRIKDWHTYFIGSPDWGFSVWAHNASCFELVAIVEKDVLKGYAIRKVTNQKVLKVFGVSEKALAEQVLQKANRKVGKAFMDATAEIEKGSKSTITLVEKADKDAIKDLVAKRAQARKDLTTALAGTDEAKKTSARADQGF